MDKDHGSDTVLKHKNIGRKKKKKKIKRKQLLEISHFIFVIVVQHPRYMDRNAWLVLLPSLTGMVRFTRRGLECVEDDPSRLVCCISILLPVEPYSIVPLSSCPSELCPHCIHLHKFPLKQSHFLKAPQLFHWSFLSLLKVL